LNRRLRAWVTPAVEDAYREYAEKDEDLAPLLERVS